MEGAVVYDLFTGKSVVPSVENIVAKSKWSLRSLLKRGLNNKVGNFIIRLWVKVNENMFVYPIQLLLKTFRLAGKARAIVDRMQPDLVHCLRLPIEGYVGGLVGYRPLVISTWGSDLVYFAQRYFIFRWLTHKTLSKTDLFFPDNTRDKYVAEVYGFSSLKPSHVICAIGGLKQEDFPIYHRDITIKDKIGVDFNTNLLLSTRGFKAYFINTEVLVRAVPQVIKEFPNTLFVLSGNTHSNAYIQLKKLAEHLNVDKRIRFINPIGYHEFLDYLIASDIFLHINIYEGWPISLLEAMACGGIPIVSNHPPLREWITDGWNGYLIDQTNQVQIAQTIIKALKNKDNFEIMRQRNWKILKERADYYKNMNVVEEMYRELVKHTSTC
jgi:glycosyltransferase involved in cell wall biosynthesis